MSNRLEHLKQAIPYCVKQTHLPWKKQAGKVRDTYDLGDQLLLVATDRLSAFDRHITNIPFKGQVLSQLSQWWFEKTAHMVDNHFISAPDPNVMLVKKCEVFPIEVIVRAYMTGSTNTSLWTLYQKGLREIAGIHLPDRLRKNERLHHPIITPTTKESTHDRPISPQELLEQQLVTAQEWDVISTAATALFQFGSQIAQKNGLILVDTKYEFGKTSDGAILLIDELHTPDSSRFWDLTNYQMQFEKGENPEQFDKEIIRLWYKTHCDPYHDRDLPEAPVSLITTVADRYITLFERLTNQSFEFPVVIEQIDARIKRCIKI